MCVCVTLFRRLTQCELALQKANAEMGKLEGENTALQQVRTTAVCVAHTWTSTGYKVDERRRGGGAVGEHCTKGLAQQERGRGQV